jgi:L-lactate utilization protein LutC
MKNIFVLVAILATSVSCQAMMRSVCMPKRKAVAPSRSFADVAHIQEKYRLPNARPGTERIAHLSREQLLTHLKHQELCFKLSKNIKASTSAKQMIKETVLNAAKTSIKPMVAGAVTMNSAHDVGPELFSFACQEAVISLKMAREAVREYQKTQKNIAKAQQALAELVAEQKRQMKVPYDIQ